MLFFVFSSLSTSPGSTPLPSVFVYVYIYALYVVMKKKEIWSRTIYGQMYTVNENIIKMRNVFIYTTTTAIITMTKKQQIERRAKRKQWRDWTKTTHDLQIRNIKRDETAERYAPNQITQERGVILCFFRVHASHITGVPFHFPENRVQT